jgi:hypothetical protein
MIELDIFGTFPHPGGTPNTIKNSILFLVPSPNSYTGEFVTYMHLLDLSGGCTGHYIEKGGLAHFISKDKDVSKYISDISIIAGEIDLLVRSQIPTRQSPIIVEYAAERAESKLNKWLENEEVGVNFFRPVHTGLCSYQDNPLLITNVYYDWGVNSQNPGNEKDSYYFTDIDLGDEINELWFLDETNKVKILDSLMENEAFIKSKYFSKVASRTLHPIYFSKKYINSLLLNFWIEFRDGTIHDLLESIENPEDYGMSKEINAVKKYLFRIQEIKNRDMFLSFLVPDLISFYEVVNATHRIREFHRIRTRLVTHSFVLRPPFLLQASTKDM